MAGSTFVATAFLGHETTLGSCFDSLTKHACYLLIFCFETALLTKQLYRVKKNLEINILENTVPLACAECIDFKLFSCYATLFK